MLLTHVENYVRTFMNGEPIHERSFHNLKHTMQVVEKCEELASFYNISEVDKEALITAAWFHDTGFKYGSINHEEKSVKIAFVFLKEFKVTPEFLLKVNALILVTKQPSNPTSLLQEILCDADLSHLASTDYAQWNTLLCRELRTQDGIDVADQDWNNQNISFFQSHHYFTEFAKTHWESQKQKNLHALMALTERPNASHSSA